MILAGILLLINPIQNYKLITEILSISMIVVGAKSLHYYFTMCRHMVGGRRILFRGLIILNSGVFAYTLTDVPKIYLILYLIVIHIFYGAVNMLRGFEALRFDSPLWRINIVQGITNLVMAVLCIIFLRRTTVVVYIYAVGLIYTSFVRILAAFKKTAVAYIP